MPLYGGVDGGGSGSRFVVLDERGTVVAESHGDTTNQWVIILRLDFLNVPKRVLEKKQNKKTGFSDFLYFYCKSQAMLGFF